ncbi:hypothetical protein AaE_015825 [Aphanomyces astaci]|uniref:Uncharacterized protein n=1 Tax=Aphanomyces astaci TaxID=112090 RepID=A0A6A4Z0L6_APHAT|nr:hypothetical protein AaE_015825 [Aphanomyces astaci]
MGPNWEQTPRPPIKGVYVDESYPPSEKSETEKQAGSSPDSKEKEKEYQEEPRKQAEWRRINKANRPPMEKRSDHAKVAAMELSNLTLTAEEKAVSGDALHTKLRSKPQSPPATPRACRVRRVPNHPRAHRVRRVPNPPRARRVLNPSRPLRFFVPMITSIMSSVRSAAEPITSMSKSGCSDCDACYYPDGNSCLRGLSQEDCNYYSDTYGTKWCAN